MRYVLGDTKIWTDLGVRTAAELASTDVPHDTIDAFGRSGGIKSTAVGEQDVAVINIGGNIVFPLGAQTELYGVVPGDGKPEHRKLTLLKGVSYAWMPSRKVRLSNGHFPGGNIFNTMPETERLAWLGARYKAFGEDNIRPKDYQSAAYFETDSLNDYHTCMEIIGLYGCGVRPRFKEHRIEIDPNRPSCWATKLLSGRGNDVEDLLSDLIDSHIVGAVLPFSRMVNTAQTYGVICEGELHENLVTVLPPVMTGQKAPMYQIEIKGRAHTVDLPFFKL